MPPRGLVLTGARCRLLLDNTKIGYATNVSYGEEITYEPIEPLDQLDVAEHVPTGYRVNFSAQIVRLVREPLKLREGVAIMPQLDRILTAASLTATIEDRLSSLVLGNIENVKASRYTINIGARGITMTDVEFVATRIKDESEII